MLLLAGSAEATALAGLLHGRGIAVVASLAGATRAPAALPVPVRTGGFGGAAGLAAALVEGGHEVLVDATHPFAAGMAGGAAIAAEQAGVPRLRVLRPPWTPGPGDDWHDAADLADAARLLDALGSRRALLALGGRHLAPFAGVAARVVVRAIDPPTGPLPAGAEVVRARPPFTVDDERALLATRAIDTVVTRNSGAAATAAKLAAARALGVQVIMVRRPPPPPGPVATDAPAALAWVEAVLDR